MPRLTATLVVTLVAACATVNEGEDAVAKRATSSPPAASGDPSGASASTASTAAKRIGTTGLVVAPRFIDIQGQSVFQLTAGDGRVVSKVTQGVTTEVMGEGASPAPVNDNIATAIPAMFAPVGDTTVLAAFRSFTGADGLDKWLHAMEKHGASVNVGPVLGTGTVRVYGKGFAQGAPSPAEPVTMRAVMANRLSIRDRGQLREGFHTDVVVFDPATIMDKATFTEPHHLSLGVQHVFANGVQVLADGIHSGATPGRVVRGPGWRGWGSS
jgi:N-acyl-D-aspartate/D-glutamate deacylase